MRIAACWPQAAWIASTSSPSWLLCTAAIRRPCSAAARSARARWSSRVAVPYTSGSRVPRRFRFGPCSTSTESGSTAPTLLRASADDGRGRPLLLEVLGVDVLDEVAELVDDLLRLLFRLGSRLLTDLVE